MVMALIKMLIVIDMEAKYTKKHSYHFLLPLISSMLMGAIMFIGAKSRCNHYLIVCFFHQFFKKKFKVENKLNFLHIIKFNILFYKCLKYEIISLTFGLSKVM